MDNRLTLNNYRKLLTDEKVSLTFCRLRVAKENATRC